MMTRQAFAAPDSLSLAPRIFRSVAGPCVEALEDSVLLAVSTLELEDVIRREDRYGRS